MPDRRTQWASAAALVGLAVAGCSGPAAPLDVGTQTVPISLVLGQLKVVDQAPIGAISGPLVPSSRPYYQPPVGAPVGQPSLSLPPLPQSSCPEYDPLASVLGVGRTITAPPVKATYSYRAQVIDAYPGKQSAFNGDSTWTIAPGPVDASTGAYDVTYTITMGSVVTTRVLRTLPRDIGAAEGTEPTDQTNPNTTINAFLSTVGAPTLPTSMPNPSGYGLAGIYLVSQESSAGTAFTPATPIALLQLRQLTGVTDKAAQDTSAITSVGYDPVNQAVMAFRSTVVNPTNKVNACGTKLESVQVSLTSPNGPGTAPPSAPLPLLDLGAAMYVEKAPSTDPTKPKANVLLFGETLDFGLQWGGLLLKDDSAVLPSGLIPNGLQLDPQDPPTATPSGAPPSGDPVETALWAGTPILEWAQKHMILKQSSFTINEKPKYPKAS